MIKSLTLAGAFIALAALPLHAQSVLGPQTVEPNSALVGTMSGSWNTPFQSEAGFAGGLLFFGVPQFALSANVHLGPSPQGSTIQGTLNGTLKPFPLSPGADVSAIVSGTWTYDSGTEQGKFQALIFTPPLPFPSGVPQILLGRLSGRFHDAYTPFGPDSLGDFNGRWTLNAITIPGPLPDADPLPGPVPSDS
ncbi:MAG: hypothetical protein DHS20C15_11500 [Planctomycetota bacterium]|nr:MAG: hypothetical protein DHS20C15_11500 [Planctomycetota bacterium]